MLLTYFLRFNRILRRAAAAAVATAAVTICPVWLLARPFVPLQKIRICVFIYCFSTSDAFNLICVFFHSLSLSLALSHRISHTRIPNQWL